MVQEPRKTTSCPLPDPKPDDPGEDRPGQRQQENAAAGYAVLGTAVGELRLVSAHFLPRARVLMSVLALLAAWIARRSDIPDQVVFLPCFWLLVPGATGLTGVSQLFVSHTLASLPTLANTAVTVAAIALGVPAGASFQRPARARVVPTGE